MTNTFILNEGSDFSFTFNWPNGSGGNANLTGFTVEVFDIPTSLAPFVTSQITTPSTGLIATTVTWNPKLSFGSPKLSFRIRIVSPSGVKTSTNLLSVVYQ